MLSRWSSLIIFPLVVLVTKHVQIFTVDKSTSLFKCHFLIVFYLWTSTSPALFWLFIFSLYELKSFSFLFPLPFQFSFPTSIPFLNSFHSNETWHAKRPLFLEIRRGFKLPKYSFQPGIKLQRQLACLRLKIQLSALSDQVLNTILCQ